MAVMGFLFFVSVLAASLWAMFATIAPRIGYITALLSGSTAASVLVPVAQRRRVRRVSALPVRPVFAPMSAAA